MLLILIHQIRCLQLRPCNLNGISLLNGVRPHGLRNDRLVCPFLLQFTFLHPRQYLAIRIISAGKFIRKILINTRHGVVKVIWQTEICKGTGGRQTPQRREETKNISILFSNFVLRRSSIAFSRLTIQAVCIRMRSFTISTSSVFSKYHGLTTTASSVK